MDKESQPQDKIEDSGLNSSEKEEQVFIRFILDKIFAEKGVDFRHYREGALKRRIAIRMKANKVSSYAEYLRLLGENPRECDNLFEIICINVSEFFRNPEIWLKLKYLFEKLIREKLQRNDRSLKIWSAGCASGEEPYSAAILLKDILVNNPENFSLEIYATDIDRACLKTAQSAVYPRERLKNCDKKYVENYFIPLGIRYYLLKEEIRNMCNSNT